MIQPGKDTPVVRERRDRRRRQIVEAAIGLFGRQGFHQTSMQQIAEAAGVSVASLYQYVPSKDAIIDLAADLQDRTNSEAFDAVHDRDGLADLLAEALRGTARIEPAEAAVVTEIWAEAARNDRIGARQRRHYANALQLATDRLRAAEPHLDEAAARAQVELPLLVQIGLFVTRAVSIPVAADAVIDLAVRGLTTPDATPSST